MRTAVNATNVVPNLAILPGMILIPSDMTILKEKIPGYNNTLLLATKSMKFGKNPRLNFSTERNEEDDDEGDNEGTEDRRDTADSRGYHLLTDLPPENQRNLGHLNAKLSKKGKVQTERLGYVTEGPNEVRNRKDKNDKELIAVFSAMSVIGALGALSLRLLAS